MDTNSKVLHMNQTAKPFNIEVSGDMPTCSDNCSTIDFTMPVASSAKPGVLRPSHTANMSPIDNSSERKRQRDRERFSTMSIEKRSEINKKRRETRQQKKEPNRTTGVPREVDIEENMDLDDNSDWLHRSEMYQANHNETSGDILTPGGAPETGGHPPNENRSRSAYKSEWYQKLTLGQRESRRECLRLYNKTPRRKEANRELKRRQREMQAIILNPESIAMEDPTFTPELVFPTIDAVEPDGSPLGARDWVILESTRRPFLPASTQTEEVGSPEMPIGPLRRKRHVPSGERQALLACRNQQFKAAIARNVSAPIEDNIDDAREADDLTQPHMTVEINNESMNLSQGPTVATNQSEGLSTQENGVERTQMMPKVNSNGDDDEGVIFKEDEDEDEGYLFVGQEEETDEEIEVDGNKDGFVAIPEVPDPYDAVYSNIPEETNMLKHVDNYVHCSAKKFEYEPPGFCCRNGKIKLSSQTTSDELVRLWSSADTDARHFHDNIRFFNGHFSFTSLYCWLDKMTTNMSDCGIYTFCAHGMLYHNIRPFGREAGTEHKHLELYFYDDDLSLEHRYQRYREEQLEKYKQVIK